MSRTYRANDKDSLNKRRDSQRRYNKWEEYYDYDEAPHVEKIKRKGSKNSKNKQRLEE